MSQSLEVATGKIFNTAGASSTIATVLVKGAEYLDIAHLNDYLTVVLTICSIVYVLAKAFDVIFGVIVKYKAWKRGKSEEK